MRCSSGTGIDCIVGKHVYGNLYGCDKRLISNERYLRRIVREAIKVAGMHLFELRSWKFESKKGGVSVIALITESHVAIHTWPEYEYATVDVYTCGEKSEPERLLTISSRSYRQRSTRSTLLIDPQVALARLSLRRFENHRQYKFILARGLADGDDR